VRWRPLAVAGLLAVSTGVVRADSQTRSRPDDYGDLVNRYRSGDADDSVAGLARLPESLVANAVRVRSSGMTRPQLVAAIMLHTDLGCSIVRALPDRARVQFNLAHKLLDVLRGRRDDRVYATTIARRWYGAIVSIYINETRLDEAALYLVRGLAAFPDDVALQLARGTIDVLRMTVNTPDPRGLEPIDDRRAQTRAGHWLDNATGAYSRVLQLDRTNARAHLHLGWVSVLQLRNDASKEFETALALAQDDATRYVAHLFLGDAAERRHQLEAALEHYEAARTLGPTHQTPYVALSRLEELLGHTARARELAEAGAGLEAGDRDPWWDFFIGGVDAEAFQWLRGEAHR
jgi:tetratricopeptide (TPR) repeat protein